MNNNGDPFSQIFWHGNTLAIETKLNKTAWKILKANKNKWNIKALIYKLMKKLKIC